MIQLIDSISSIEMYCNVALNKLCIQQTRVKFVHAMTTVGEEINAAGLICYCLLGECLESISSITRLLLKISTICNISFSFISRTQSLETGIVVDAKVDNVVEMCRHDR